jgi:hypothetical protein
VTGRRIHYGENRIGSSRKNPHRTALLQGDHLTALSGEGGRDG